jgi:hypothetical protein
MANAIEQRGFFWWAGDPSRPSHSHQTAVPGLLTVTAEGRISLEVDGALASAFPADYDRENYAELRIDLRGLEEWLQLDSLRAERDYGAADGERDLVSYINHRFESSIDDGTMSIESFTSGGSFFGLFGDYARRKISFEQSFTLVYRPTLPSSLAHLQYVFAKIEQLLSLFLGSYFRLNRPHFVRKEEPDDQWDTIFAYGDAPSTEELNRFFFLVPFAEIRDQFGPLLQTWLNKSEAFGAGFYLYTASLRNQQTYSEDRLFALASGIEALHRKGVDSDSSQSSQDDRNRAQRLLALIPADHPDKRRRRCAATRTRAQRLSPT